MDKRLTFFSSRWSELPFEDLLEIDDQNAFEWQKEDSLKRLLLQLSGWHFEYWLANKTSFPFLSNNIDSFRIAALEDLREASEFEIPRYLVRKNSLEYFKADLVRLMRIPILHRSPLFHSKNATKLSAEEINEQQDREAALSKPLLEQFFVTLAKCDARTQSIVRLRLGVGLDKPMTLEEIGSEIGVTRERIRQVEAKFYKQSEETEYWDDILREKLSQLYSESSDPLTLVKLEVMDPWFGGVTNRPLVFNTILTQYNNKSSETNPFFVVFHLSRDPIVSALRPDEIDEAIREARHTIKQYFKDGGIRLDEAKDLAAAMCPQSIRNCRDIFTEAVLSKWRNDSLSSSLVFGNSRRAKLDALLRDGKDRTWTFKEIQAEYHRLFGERVKSNEVSNACMQNLSQVAFGTWAKKTAFQLEISQLGEIIKFIKASMRLRNSIRQWHAEELYSMAPEDIKGLCKYEAYSIYFCAQEEKDEIASLGRQVIGWKKHYQDSTDRLETRDLLLAALAQSETPLSKSEIVSYITKYRGLGSHYQIHPDEQILQMSDGKYTLAK